MLVEGTVNVLAFGTLAVGGSISMTNAGLVASCKWAAAQARASRFPASS